MATSMTRVTMQLRMPDTKRSIMHILTMQEMEFQVKIHGKNENFTLNRYCVSESCTDGLVFTVFNLDSSHVQLVDVKVACAALCMLLTQS